MHYIKKLYQAQILNLFSYPWKNVSTKTPRSIPSEDAAMVILKISQDVFLNVRPHIINMSLWYLSKMINMRLFSIIATSFMGLSHLRPHKNWLDTAIATVSMMTSIISVADLSGVIPHKTTYRVGIDSLLFLVTAIGSSRAITEGTHRMFSCWNAKETKTTSKISNFVSGMVLTTLGTAGLGNCFQAGIRLVGGLKKLQTLDPLQKQKALKYRSVDSLNHSHTCNAIVFDGDQRGYSYPFTEELYRHCKTKTYEVESPDQFCEALHNAHLNFGTPINVLSFQGHANSEGFVLGYFFTADQQEITCMNNTLSPDSQIFLLGCNTATPNAYQTLTEKMSQGLPGKEITGFSSEYNPFFSTTRYSNNRFSHSNYFRV